MIIPIVEIIGPIELSEKQENASESVAPLSMQEGNDESVKETDPTSA